MSGNQERESTMYFLLHKVLHFETLEDRIFDLENKNIELDVNYKILKSELDKITNKSQDLVDDADDNVTDHYDEIESSQNISPILNDNCGPNSNSNVNPIEFVWATLGHESESQEYKDVENESSMSMGQLDPLIEPIVNSDSGVMEDFNSNPVGFIDMFDQLLMEDVKNKPTTVINNNTVEIDTSIEIEDQKPLFDILPYEKLKLNLNPIVLLKRIDPPLCLRTTQKESKKRIPLKQSKAKEPKKSAKCQVGLEKEQPKKVSATITSKKSESYKCIICLKNISHKKLATHYQSHKIRVDVKSQNFECKICPKLFQIRVDFVRHMREEHLGMKVHECTTCLKKFTSSLKLTTHMKVHTGEKPYSCTICKRQFSHKQSLSRHKRIHNEEKPYLVVTTSSKKSELYKCIICLNKMNNREELAAHYQSHNANVDVKLKNFQCKICPKLFQIQSDFVRHMGGHLEKKSAHEYECPTLRKFESSLKLTTHMRVHTGAEKPYSCSVCKRKFSHNSSLNFHKRSHNGEKPKPYLVSATIKKSSKKSESYYKCIICLNKMNNREELADHYQSHNANVDVKLKNFECKICPKPKLFKFRVDFVRHMREEHLEKKKNPLECPLCLRKFTSNLALTAHMRVHTGEKPYPCSVCKRQFSQIASLNRHKRIHSGEKPYGCQLCPKFFRVKEHMVIHTRYHTGERPYECSTCFKKFVCKSALNVHNKTGHKNLKKCK